ncbi:MAG: methyltransferase domain-containing protein [bacterium]|nr:methyltransferase domain-containing protein [bacterium]
MKKRHILTILVLMGLVLSAPGLWGDQRDTWQQPQKVMEAIGVKPGMKIGEPGAGKGYFTFKLAHKVGLSGQIYANDIDDDSLDTLKERIREDGFENITAIKGELTNPLFPEGELDMVFMCYVLHDLEKPGAFLKNLKPALKWGAPLVILERDPGKYPSAAGHFFKKEKLMRVVKRAGYKLVRIETFLPRDLIYIYQAK